MLESKDLEQIAMLLEKSAEKTNEKITGIQNQMLNMENKISGIEAQMLNMENKISGIEAQMLNMENKVSGIEDQILNMENKISEIQNEIVDVKLTIENETNRNIKIIAEGHLDLSKKYSEILNDKAVDEFNQIRLNILSEEVRKIKKKMECIA